MPVKHIQQLGENEVGLACIVHKQGIYARRDIGLLKYYHTNDDSLCEVLNSLNITGEAIIGALSLQATLQDTPLNCVCFRFNEGARGRCYAELGKVKRLQDVVARLHIILKWVDNKPDLQKRVFKEMAILFGPVVLDNLALVAQQMKYSISAFALYKADASKIPSYTMPDIKDLQKQEALKKLQQQGNSGNGKLRAKALQSGK